MGSGNSPSPTPVRNLPERLQGTARPQRRPWPAGEPPGAVPGDQAVASAEGGGVQLEDGGDVVALGHGHQGVHHLLLGVAQPAAGGVLVGVRLRRGLGSGRCVQTPLTAAPGPRERERRRERDLGRKGTGVTTVTQHGRHLHAENSPALPSGLQRRCLDHGVTAGLRAERRGPRPRRPIRHSGRQSGCLRNASRGLGDRP